MRIRSRILTLVLSTSLAGFASSAWAASRASLGTEKTSHASELADQVRDKLVTLPWYGIFDSLNYQVKGTEVVLSGQVISQHSQTKYDAEKAVKSISGVTKVANNIEVLPPSNFDDQIRRAEYRAIFSQSDLGRYTMGAIPQVHIIVKNGHVTLEGQVMNQMDRNIAGVAANSVPGVFSVENNLQVG
jgi:hyperosmotically inducible protein